MNAVCECGSGISPRRRKGRRIPQEISNLRALRNPACILRRLRGEKSRGTPLPMNNGTYSLLSAIND
jgi:hypothetical protein